MLSGFVNGLIAAWFLTLVNVNNMLIEVIQPFVSLELTDSHYYIAFAMIGLIGGAFSRKE